MKQLIAMITASFLLLTSGLVLVPAVAFASSSASRQDACAALTQLDGTQDCSSSGGAVGSLPAKIVNILSFIVGLAAIIAIIVGGLKYVTSGGDSAKVASAKGAIIWALVGLVVVLLAQSIVHFVLNRAS